MKKILIIICSAIRIITIFLLIGLLVFLLYIIENHPLIEANMIWSMPFFMFWATTGGFAYNTQPPTSKFSTEHYLKPFWLVLFILTTLICIPAGLLLRIIYYTNLRKKDGITLSKKFYFFFQKEFSI